jgi:hypothetical protein
VALVRQKETDRLANECFQIQNWLRWSADNATRYRNLMCANYDRCLATVTEIINKEKHAGKGTRRLDDDVRLGSVVRTVKNVVLANSR